MIRKGTKVQFQLIMFKDGKLHTFVGKVTENYKDGNLLVWAKQKAKKTVYKNFLVSKEQVQKYTPKVKKSHK